jgi:predicted permease
MMRVLAPALVFQLYSPLLSAAREESEQQPLEVETVSVIYVALFGIIFIGMIVGFFIRLFINEKKAETEEK